MIKLLILFVSITCLNFQINASVNNPLLNKFDINNTASISIYKLFRHLGLSEQQGVILINYRKRLGGFENIHQVNYIIGLKKKVKKILIKYFYANPLKISLKEILNKTNNWSNENNELEYFIEHIQFFINNPININTASIFDLLKIPFISQSAAASIIRNRKINGPFTHTWQILKIRSIIPELYYCLRPLITVYKKTSKKNHSFIHRINGSISSRYYNKYSSNNNPEFSPYIYTKIILEINKSFQFNTCLSKSILEKGSFPGRWFKSEKFNFFDSAVYNFQFKNLEFIPILLFGNFTLNFGEGLIFDSGFGGSNFNLIGNKHEREGIRAKAGSSKNNLFEGIAVYYTNRIARISSFFSSNSFDASTKDGIITSKLKRIISSDPIHTETFNNKNRDSLREVSFGINITSHLFENFKTSIRFVNYSYQKEILPRLEADSYYSFRGKKLFQIGFDFHFILEKMSIFCEAALSNYNKKSDNSSDKIQYGLAGIFGINWRFKSISLCLRYHNIEPGFISPHGLLSHDKTGQRGISIAFNKNFNRTFYFKTSLQILSKIWRSYYNELPVIKKNYGIEFIFKPFNFFSLKASINNKSDNLEDNSNSLTSINIKRKIGFSIKILKSIDSNLSYYETFQESSKPLIKNNIFSFRINIKHNSLKLSIGGHLFNVEDTSIPVFIYNTRLYFWHEGILSYYNSGSSFFLLSEHSGKSIKYGLKYNRINYKNLPIEHRIRIQMILKF